MSGTSTKVSRSLAGLVLAGALAACSNEMLLVSKRSSESESREGNVTVKNSGDVTVATRPKTPIVIEETNPGSTDQTGLQLTKQPVSLRSANEYIEHLGALFGLNYSESANSDNSLDPRFFSVDFRALRAGMAAESNLTNFSGTVQHAMVRVAARGCRLALETAALSTRLMGTVAVVDQPNATAKPSDVRLTQIATQLASRLVGYDLLGVAPPAEMVTGLVTMARGMQSNNERRLAVAMCVAISASAYGTLY